MYRKSVRMNLPKKCLVDTNVPKTANYALDPESIPQELLSCVPACIKIIEHVTKKRGRLVIDKGDEIFNEYRQQLCMSGQPGVGDRFLKWVHDNRWSLPNIDRVAITKKDNSYEQFPCHDNLKAFDKADQKFVAVAYAHPEKPPISQATDSKWWGWKETLAEVGIVVNFLCPDYVRTKYGQKMKNST